MQKSNSNNNPGLYIIEFSPPPLGGGGEIKGSGDGEGNQRGEKREKKGNLGKIKLLTVLNHKTRLLNNNFTLFKP